MSSEPAIAAGPAPARVASSDDTGQFTITGVLPGRYTLVTRPLPIANQPSTNLSGAADVTVSGDVDFSGEIRKGGLRIALQEQPLRILTALLERPGEVISREALCQRLLQS